MATSYSRFDFCRQWTIILSTLAFGLSYYTVYVGREKLNNPHYKAVCDLSERLTCSAVFASDFGKGFGVVDKIFGAGSVLSQLNGVYGLILYPILVFCSLFALHFVAKIELAGAICGGIASTYGFINAFWLSPYLCLVCLTMHSINYILIISAMTLCIVLWGLYFVFKVPKVTKNAPVRPTSCPDPQTTTTDYSPFQMANTFWKLVHLIPVFTYIIAEISLAVLLLQASKTLSDKNLRLWFIVKATMNSTFVLTMLPFLVATVVVGGFYLSLCFLKVLLTLYTFWVVNCLRNRIILRRNPEHLNGIGRKEPIEPIPADPHSDTKYYYSEPEVTTREISAYSYEATEGYSLR